MNVNEFSHYDPVVPNTPDIVDGMTSQWNTVRPDLDVSPMAVIGRISRLSRLVDRRLEHNFATVGR